MTRYLTSEFKQNLHKVRQEQVVLCQSKNNLTTDSVHGPLGAFETIEIYLVAGFLNGYCVLDSFYNVFVRRVATD